jgi:hypothetical protein
MAKENGTRKLKVDTPSVRRKLEDVDQNLLLPTLGVEEYSGKEVSVPTIMHFGLFSYIFVDSSCIHLYV